MYVIKFDNNLYWCGYNTADKQLRKAIIYKSIKQAVAAAEDWSRLLDFKPFVWMGVMD